MQGEKGENGMFKNRHDVVLRGIEVELYSSQWQGSSWLEFKSEGGW